MSALIDWITLTNGVAGIAAVISGVGFLEVANNDLVFHHHSVVVLVVLNGFSVMNPIYLRYRIAVSLALKNGFFTLGGILNFGLNFEPWLGLNLDIDGVQLRHANAIFRFAIVVSSIAKVDVFNHQSFAIIIIGNSVKWQGSPTDSAPSNFGKWGAPENAPQL